MFFCIFYFRGFIVKGFAFFFFNRYFLVRDIIFFVFDFYIGNRVFDLGRLKVDQFFYFKDREGFFLNFTFSKIRRVGQFSFFILLCILNVFVCLVFLLNFYIVVCGVLGVFFYVGYFFRFSEYKKFKLYRLFVGLVVFVQF